jgi:hypothetical protein
MSPYDTSVLRDLKDYMEANPDSIQPNPPRSVYRPPQGPEILASCVSPSDLTHERQEEWAPPVDPQKQHDEHDWSQDCLWCDPQWKLTVKLLTAARSGDADSALAALDEGADVNAR